jgi:hypothetical protein
VPKRLILAAAVVAALVLGALLSATLQAAPERPRVSLREVGPRPEVRVLVPEFGGEVPSLAPAPVPAPPAPSPPRPTDPQPGPPASDPLPATEPPTTEPFPETEPPSAAAPPLDGTEPDDDGPAGILEASPTTP